MTHDPKLKPSSNYVQNRCRCDECRNWANEYARARRAADPQKSRAQARAYWDTHADERKSYRRAWYAKNRDQAIERAGAYVKENPIMKMEQNRRGSTRRQEKQVHTAASAVRKWSDWTEDDDKALRENWTLENYEIALMLGRTLASVSRRRTALLRADRQQSDLLRRYRAGEFPNAVVK